MPAKPAPISKFRRLTRTHRQLVAAALVGIASMVVVSIAKPAPPATTQILVASRSLPAGHTLADSDLATTQWPMSVGPPPSVADPEQLRGRVTAGPLALGEPLSMTRVVGPGLLELAGSSTATGIGSAALVAAPVRLADAGQATLIRPGDTVDVVAARAIDSGGQSAERIATDVRVITIAAEARDGANLLSSGDSSSETHEPGSLIVLAVSPATATELAAAATRSQIGIVLKPTSAAIPDASASS